MGGDLHNGKYVGDLKCWPFSTPKRLRGAWLISLEASEFYPNVGTVREVSKRQTRTWLESDLLEHRPELLAAARGAGTRIYAVEFQGRESLCDGYFGHMGMAPREVIVDRFYSMRLLSKPKG